MHDSQPVTRNTQRLNELNAPKLVKLKTPIPDYLLLGSRSVPYLDI
jgi:hypothetical protein